MAFVVVYFFSHHYSLLILSIYYPYPICILSLSDVCLISTLSLLYLYSISTLSLLYLYSICISSKSYRHFIFTLFHSIINVIIILIFISIHFNNSPRVCKRRTPVCLVTKPNAWRQTSTKVKILCQLIVLHSEFCYFLFDGRNKLNKPHFFSTKKNLHFSSFQYFISWSSYTQNVKIQKKAFQKTKDVGGKSKNGNERKLIIAVGYFGFKVMGTHTHRYETSVKNEKLRFFSFHKTKKKT